MNAKNHAFVIEDNPANRDFLTRLLIAAGFNVFSAAAPSAGIEHLRALPAGALALGVLDMELPEMNGIQLTSVLRAMQPNAAIVVATMHDERSLADAVFAKGADVFLVKPHGFMELYHRLTAGGTDALRHGPRLVIDQFGVREVAATTQV
jgi:DNA-binding response OmpR family regulator